MYTVYKTLNKIYSKGYGAFIQYNIIRETNKAIYKAQHRARVPHGSTKLQSINAYDTYGINKSRNNGLRIK